MSKRQDRRHHLERMKAKSRRVYRVFGGEIHRKAHYWANHMAICSCHGCGNPRKWFKEKTRAEVEFFISADEQVSDRDGN